MEFLNEILNSLKIQIDVNTRDNNNNTPLSIAKGRGYHDAFEYLERQKLYKFSRKFDIRYSFLTT